ncbi:MAG: Hsp33 family molecular chaperone HslO, partial [Lachnospiraceae bacterium]|nr:Hsp33 family molecular chaperone HslO [Lachnospiraceae bacterium]
LDVGGALGPGILSVIKDLGLKEPYVGQTVLQTGEIGDDLTFYFATSEQVPSSVGLGVLMEKDNTVKQAGGFIIQLMPFAQEDVIVKLEENLKKVDSVTALLEAGKSAEQILEVLLGNLGVEFTDTMPVSFTCNCTKERVSKALVSVGKEELKSMIEEGKTIEVNCHFCNTFYHFTVEELKELRKKALR